MTTTVSSKVRAGLKPDAFMDGVFAAYSAGERSNTYANRAFNAVYGISADDLVAATLTDLAS